MNFEDSSTTEKKGGDFSSHDDSLLAYSKQLEQTCARIVNIGKIVFLGDPVFLLILQNLASLDKTSVLIAWIIGMFALALVLLLVGFFDYSLRERIEEAYGDQKRRFNKLRLLQGSAFLKAVKAERSKGVKDMDKLTERLTQYAIEDNENPILDKVIGRVSKFDADELEEREEEDEDPNILAIIESFNNKFRGKKANAAKTAKTVEIPKDEPEENPDLVNLDDIVSSTLESMSLSTDKARSETKQAAISAAEVLPVLPIMEEIKAETFKQENSNIGVEKAESKEILNTETVEALDSQRAETPTVAVPEKDTVAPITLGEISAHPATEEKAEREKADALGKFRTLFQGKSTAQKPGEDSNPIHPDNLSTKESQIVVKETAESKPHKVAVPVAPILTVLPFIEKAKEDTSTQEISDISVEKAGSKETQKLETVTNLSSTEPEMPAVVIPKEETASSASLGEIQDNPSAGEELPREKKDVLGKIRSFSADTIEKMRDISADAREKIQEISEDVSWKIQDISEDAREKIRDISADAREKVQEISEDVSWKIQDVSTDVPEKLRDLFQEKSADGKTEDSNRTNPAGGSFPDSRIAGKENAESKGTRSTETMVQPSAKKEKTPAAAVSEEEAAPPITLGDIPYTESEEEKADALNEIWALFSPNSTTEEGKEDSSVTNPDGVSTTESSAPGKETVKNVKTAIPIDDVLKGISNTGETRKTATAAEPNFQNREMLTTIIPEEETAPPITLGDIPCTQSEEEKADVFNKIWGLFQDKSATVQPEENSRLTNPNGSSTTESRITNKETMESKSSEMGSAHEEGQKVTPTPEKTSMQNPKAETEITKENVQSAETEEENDSNGATNTRYVQRIVEPVGRVPMEDRKKAAEKRPRLSWNLPKISNLDDSSFLREDTKEPKSGEQNQNPTNSKSKADEEQNNKDKP